MRNEQVKFVKSLCSDSYVFDLVCNLNYEIEHGQDEWPHAHCFEIYDKYKEIGGMNENGAVYISLDKEKPIWKLVFRGRGFYKSVRFSHAIPSNITKKVKKIMLSYKMKYINSEEYAEREKISNSYRLLKPKNNQDFFKNFSEKIKVKTEYDYQHGSKFYIYNKKLNRTSSVNYYGKLNNLTELLCHVSSLNLERRTYAFDIEDPFRAFKKLIELDSKEDVAFYFDNKKEQIKVIDLKKLCLDAKKIDLIIKNYVSYKKNRFGDHNEVFADVFENKKYDSDLDSFTSRCL